MGDDCCTSTNGAPFANLSLGNYAGSDADKGAFTYGDFSTEVYARGNVNMVGNVVMMIDGGAGVDDDVVAYCGSGVNDCSSTDHTANADGGGG